MEKESTTIELCNRNPFSAYTYTGFLWPTTLSFLGRLIPIVMSNTLSNHILSIVVTLHILAGSASPCTLIKSFHVPDPPSSHLHLLVPTLLLPANHGSRMKMHLKVSLLRMPLSRAGLSLSRSPLRNQCTVCFLRELLELRVISWRLSPSRSSHSLLHLHTGAGPLHIVNTATPRSLLRLVGQSLYARRRLPLVGPVTLLC